MRTLINKVAVKPFDDRERPKASGRNALNDALRRPRRNQQVFAQPQAPVLVYLESWNIGWKLSAGLCVCRGANATTGCVLTTEQSAMRCFLCPADPSAMECQTLCCRVGGQRRGQEQLGEESGREYAGMQVLW